MTVVEAASQGAPSIVHNALGAIGAADLLSPSPDSEEVIGIDMTAGVHELAGQVLELLVDNERLHQVAERAYAKARSWSEEANAKSLMSMVQNVLVLE
jgi:hypothetical protein